MRPLVVVDLESVVDPEAGRLVVASVHAHVAPDRPLVVLDPHEATFASALTGAAGIFVTGSQAMLDTVDWAKPLAAALEAAAHGGVPVLGVCFAHQMLAAHFGATIGSFDAVRLGVPSIEFDATGPFAAGNVSLIHTHRDHVTSVPPTMNAVATGGFGGIAALAHRDLPIWTLQGHPEWTPEICRHDGKAWSTYANTDLDTPGARTILARYGAQLAKA